MDCHSLDIGDHISSSVGLSKAKGIIAESMSDLTQGPAGN